MIRRPPRSTRTDNAFPTRRSSDLERLEQPFMAFGQQGDVKHPRAPRRARKGDLVGKYRLACPGTALNNIGRAFNEAAVQDAIETFDRSEEHTSELQSLMRISYAVFCLKKKKTTKQQDKQNQ